MEPTKEKQSTERDDPRRGTCPIKPEYLKPRTTFIPKPVVDQDTSLEKEKDPKTSSSFKKRPREPPVDRATTLCRAVASSGNPDACPFGAKCNRSHDVLAYLNTKEPDLGPVCPNFQKLGYCKFGFTCRYGGEHIKTKSGLEKEEAGQPTHGFVNVVLRTSGPVSDESSEYVNELRHPTRVALRKQKYEFKTMPLAKQKNKRKGKPDLSPAEMDSQNVENAEKQNECNLPEIRQIDFQNKIYIAPLTTVGNLPFRRIMKGFGADITCGEMAMAGNLLQAQSSEWALLKRHKSEDVFGVQLASGFPDHVARASELIARECAVDFIDLNMGCPIDLVCDAGAGSKLMQRPKQMKAVICAALTGIEVGGLDSNVSNNKVPALTVKMRTGWDHKKPSAHTSVPLIQTYRASKEYLNPIWSAKLSLNGQWGVQALTIHGRSRLMRYTKLANWSYICESADARISVSDSPKTSHNMAMIGNGDVLSYEEFHEHLESHQLDTCMLARGALIKPWLSTEIKERRHWDISSSERLDILKNFAHFGLEHWGSDQMGVNTTRRFLLEWLSFLCRYVPVGLLEQLPQRINDRPDPFMGRNDLETLMGSSDARDWVKLSELVLGKVPQGFQFRPKHQANAYA